MIIAVRFQLLLGLSIRCVVARRAGSGTYDTVRDDDWRGAGALMTVGWAYATGAGA
jgi:hypothetical protein